MNSITALFSTYYDRYDSDEINRKFKKLTFPPVYKDVRFKGEVRMNNHTLALRVETDMILPDQLMTAIGYYFSNYNYNKNCVWTKLEFYIKKFFEEGILQLKAMGLDIKLKIDAPTRERIVKLFFYEDNGNVEFLRLCEDFELLENMSWRDYVKHIRAKIKEEENAHIKEVTSMDLPLDWENVFSNDQRTEDVHANSVPDGLIMSLTNLGKVDIEYISQITGCDYKTVITSLKGSIYQNPKTWDECFYKGWETADEYLSGRMVDKWKAAKEADRKYNGYFADNVAAIERILPRTATGSEIYVTLGSPWVPTDIIDDFIGYLFGAWHFLDDPERVEHDAVTGTWHIPYKSKYRDNVKSETTYGTRRINAMHIIERTLNMKSVTVMDEVSCPTNKSGKKRVVNKKETMLALEKQSEIKKEFQKWIWSDPVRKKRLEEIFESKFGSNVVRHFDGSFLTFPGMKASLYPYQKNAVARILFSPNTLLAHDVGSGKTYIMIAAGMELKRMGISKKNLYVVPNNIMGQWRDMFLELYPQSEVLCVEPKSFTYKKRNDVLRKIRDDDYDGIIMAYSCFEQLPFSREYHIGDIKSQIKELNDFGRRKGYTATIENKIDKLKEKLKELQEAVVPLYDEFSFDKLGINTLFVDEAHNYKNMAIDMKIDRVLGISKTGSAKCRDMLNKVRLVQQQNDGRGVVMATGTPITNSVTDIYVMQKYLQNGELTLLDLQSFDGWIGMFAETNTQFEIDVDTNSYRMATRFSKFHNLPELAALLSNIADFHCTDKSNDIPDFNGYSDVLIEKTAEFSSYLESISTRADDVRHGRVKMKDDNMLKITTDGRKAALDLRLVNPKAVSAYQSKVVQCAQRVFEIYTDTYAQNSTQLVFCDTSTPKSGFNMYDELSELLIGKGVPKEQIAYIHDADTDKKRNVLFGKVRKGEIRVLIGSTFKLGLGVNVQDRLIAIHHLDIPWRPADMVQREGRILRQGNRNSEVQIFRYITKGSFDAYSWQLLETKQKFISELLSGNMSDRSGADVDDTVLDYAEVKALAIGNPLIKKRVETANELSRQVTLQRQLVETRQRLEKELLELPAEIAYQKKLISACVMDIGVYAKSKREYEQKERKKFRERIYGRVIDNLLSAKEETVCEYQGFKIITPTNMSVDKLYVWVQHHGRYYVPLGESESGVLIRIDNFLEDMNEHLKKLKNRLDILSAREVDIKAELESKEGYTDRIEQLREELEKIDKELGVKK